MPEPFFPDPIILLPGWGMAAVPVAAAAAAVGVDVAEAVVAAAGDRDTKMNTAHTAF